MLITAHSGPPSTTPKIYTSCLRERPRGVENSGGWKTYRKFGEKNPPQKRFWTPHLRYVSPPPLFWRLSVISLKRERHRPDQPHFLRLPKVVLESTLCSTFSPPPNSRDTFCPPLSLCPIVSFPGKISREKARRDLKFAKSACSEKNA